MTLTNNTRLNSQQMARNARVKQVHTANRNTRNRTYKLVSSTLKVPSSNSMKQNDFGAKRENKTLINMGSQGSVDTLSNINQSLFSLNGSTN